MRPVRALHICQRDDIANGGAVRVAAELVRRLPNHGIDAHCLFLYGEAGTFGERLGQRAHYLGLRNSREFWNYRKLFGFLLKFQPDFMHHHDALIWPQLATAFMPGGIKVNHAHLDAIPASQRSTRDHAAALAMRAGTRMLVAVSEFTRETHLRYNYASPHRAVVVSNGVDAEQFPVPSSEQKQAARRSFEVPTNAVVIGQVGRLHMKIKGNDYLLKAIASLPERFYGLIAGHGGDLDNLKGMTRELGIANRVIFTGHLAEPLRAYHAMDVFAFTSSVDSFGLVVAEAMACGIPVVGFHCPGGSTEMLDDKTGWRFAERRHEDIARAVLQLTADPQGTAAVVRRARERILSRFEWDGLARRLADNYFDFLPRPC